MAKLNGPGDDNITGDNFEFDLGVKPDLGDLLKNIQVANKLLDETEARFHAIAQAVGSTAQAMSQLTRQTELAATQSQRLQNSYQSIASAGQTLAGIGSMVGGMGGYGMPGQMAFGGMGMMGGYGMPPAAMAGMETAGSEGIVPREDFPEYAPPADNTPNHFPLSVRAAAIEDIAERFNIGQKKGPISTRIAKFKSGFKAKGWKAGGEATSWNDAQQAAAESAAQAPVGKATEASLLESMRTPEGLGEANMADLLAATPTAAMEGEGAVSAVPGLAGAEAIEGAGGAGLLGSLGGMAASAAPYAAAAYAGYKLWADSVAGGRRLSGITGGTGAFTGGVGGGFGEMKFAALRNSFLNPGVNLTEIQEKTLGAGYTDQNPAGMLQQSQDYMMQAYKKGMNEVIDQIDLFAEVVDKAGGSTGSLVDAMDDLQTVAKNSNASLTAMAQNYEANIEQFVAIGMSGNAANFAAVTGSTAWAQSGTTNPTLRNAGGYDLSNPYARAQVANAQGVSYGTLSNQMLTSPSAASLSNVQIEDSAINFLSGLGFSKEISDQGVEAVIDHATSIGMGMQEILGPQLAQLGFLPQGMDGSDAPAVAAYIQQIFGRPQKAAASEAIEASKSKAIGSVELPTQGFSIDNVMHLFDSDHEVEKPHTTTTAQTEEGSAQYLSEHDFEFDEGHPLGAAYQDFIMNTGENIPAIEALDPDERDRTYIVGEDNQPVPLGMWLANHPEDAGQLLDSGKAKIVTAGVDQQDTIKYDPTKGYMVNKSGSGQTTTQDLVTSAGPASLTVGGVTDNTASEAPPTAAQMERLIKAVNEI